MLDTFVVLYLFLGGCGAGSLLLCALWSLLFFRTRTRTMRQSRRFRLLQQVLYGVSLTVLVLAALCLLLDLGQPGKALLLFVRPTASLLSVGSFVLVGCLLVAALLLAVSLGVLGAPPLRLHRLLEAVGMILATAMLFYTGLYLAWMPAVPLWHNGALPFLLAFSSLSSGMALAAIALWLCRAGEVLPGWVALLHRVHGWVIAAMLACFCLFAGLAALDPFARPALLALFDPAGRGSWLIGGFLAAGSLVPLGAEVVRRWVAPVSPLVAAEVLCLLGGLILRFCLVSAGSHWLG